MHQPDLPVIDCFIKAFDDRVGKNTEISFEMVNIRSRKKNGGKTEKKTPEYSFRIHKSRKQLFGSRTYVDLDVFFTSPNPWTHAAHVVRQISNRFFQPCTRMLSYANSLM